MIGRLSIIPAALAVTLTLACSDDGGSPSTPSVTIGAPGIISPNGGVQAAGEATLTLTNASVSSGTASYEFQVATDSGFSNIVAQTSNVPQGSSQTSWVAGSNFESGELFWRARASVGSTQGPFSAVGNFQYQAGISSSGRTDQILLADPLLNGTSLGDVGGGIFTSEGWEVEASSNFIVYDMQTIETGFLEFDVKGLDYRNPHRDARHIFYMWDPSLGSDMTSNRYRVSLQKLDPRSSINDRFLRLRFISQGRQIDVANTFRGWNPEQTYRIRLEWGREGDVNACRLFIDNQQKFFFQYARTYNPQIHRIELGAAGRAESPEGAIYSNVAIGTR